MNAPCKTIDSRWPSPALVPAGIVCLLLLLVPPLPAAVLTHRYPFDTNAVDVIGGADGILQGNAFITNGAVVFDGVNSGVQLPANLFTNYDSITFEAWYIDHGRPPQTVASNAPIYEFANSGAMAYYDSMDFGIVGSWGLGAYTTNTGTTPQNVLIPLPTPDRTNHLVWTQDSNSRTASIYVNGSLAGQNTNFTFTPSNIGKNGGWLGRSFASNSPLLGDISEFRIYRGALSALEVAQLDVAGPDQTQVTPGTLQGIRLILPATYGPGALLQPGVFANYANLTNVNIISQPDLILTCDNTNILRFVSGGKIRTRAFGTAGITAIYQGFSNTVAVTVAIPQDYLLAHRYAFDESNDFHLVHDSVGQAHLVTKGAITNGGYQAGVAQFPAGIISSLSEVTIEMWMTYLGPGGPGSPFSEKIFEFDNSAGTNVNTCFYLAPSINTFTPYPSVPRATVTTNSLATGTLRLDWTNPLQANTYYHLAIAYSPVRGTASLYANGAPVSSVQPLFSLPTFKTSIITWANRLYFQSETPSGEIFSEFRIYSGFLRDSDIAADYAAGPNVIGTDFILHSSVSGTNLTLSWSPAMANWLLQSSPAVDPNASWSPVNTTTNFQNNRYSVTLPMSGASEIFRLHQGP